MVIPFDVEISPKAPTGLSVIPGNNSVTLNWTDNIETDLAGYRVYRSNSESGPYDSIASGVEVSNYLDSIAVNCNVYFYYVTAVDHASNESEPSGPAYASLRPKGDLTGDCFVKLADFALFSQNWLDSDCWYCNGADLDDNKQVDIEDLRLLIENWL